MQSDVTENSGLEPMIQPFVQTSLCTNSVSPAASA
jgi:hypothetical protein